MKKSCLLSFFFWIALLNSTFSQGFAINTSGAMADTSAGLDVAFNSKGILIPRVSLTSMIDTMTVPRPANSLIVFNINPNMTNGNGVGLYYYCSAGCTTAGWKFLTVANSAPGLLGQVLTSQGAGIAPKWDTQISSEWAFVSKLTFSNSSAQQNFSSLVTHDYWKLVFTVHNNGATFNDRIILGFGVNGVISSYQNVFHTNSGIFSNTGLSNWIIYNSGADDFDTFNGESIITGKQSTSLNLKSFYANGSGGLLSGYIGTNGRLAGDANDVISINIIPTNPITGTVELWYKDNR